MSASATHIEVGRVRYDAGSDNVNEQNETFQVTFDKKFAGIPNVSLSVENSNKTAVAQNVNSTGFQIIISDSGFDTGETVIYVHYYAILN